MPRTVPAEGEAVVVGDFEAEDLPEEAFVGQGEDSEVVGEAEAFEVGQGVATVVVVEEAMRVAAALALATTHITELGYTTICELNNLRS